ncbi:MAG: hypothetical protein SO424_08650 [[Pasteurella] aerogenes]|nr:hypothetical protein [[Pasteurella] aerogenes]
MSIKLEYNFWAVGQGLFSNGVVKDAQSDKVFHWVYDCGTSSGQQFVQNAIRAMRHEYPVNDIDLLVISHFARCSFLNAWGERSVGSGTLISFFFIFGFTIFGGGGFL